MKLLRSCALIVVLVALAGLAQYVPPGGSSSTISSGTTGTIGGSVNLGECLSGTATVSGVTTSMVITATPVTYPGDALVWEGYRSAANTVTVKLCYFGADAFITAPSSVYNVRAIP